MSGNLPAQLTKFVGREREISEVVRLLGASRIVTLTGSGGCGKTRLALQIASKAAATHPDGVWWVDLASVGDPETLPSTVATALSVREAPRRSITETIAKELSRRRALILLDNCEHVVEASSDFVHTILGACPRVTVLATSRRSLRVEGEVAFRVPSLQLPHREDEVDGLLATEAVRLFVDRARRARPGFAVTRENARAVTEICRRLDGMPLAIELAAARMRVFSVQRIAAELTDAFRILTEGARTGLPRHRTLRASVEWSHALLPDEERVMLRRLSVFAGGFTLDAAEAVAPGGRIHRGAVLDLLARLTDHSLVQVDEHEPDARYRLLETIRQYAAQKLDEAGEADDVRRRHLAFYMELAEGAEPHLEGARMRETIRMLRTEQGNIRTALDWGPASGHGQEALRLAAALRTFWFAEGPWSEARARYEALLDRGIPDSRIRARGLLGAATVCFQLFDWPAARAYAEQALSIAEEVDDRRTSSRALSALGTACMWTGNLEGARPLWERAVGTAQEIGDEFTVSQTYWGLANGQFLLEGDVRAAEVAFEASVAAARRSGNPFRLGMALAMFGNLSGWTDPRRSQTLLEEGVEHLEMLGESAFRAAATAGLAWVRLLRGDLDGGRRQAEDAVRLADDAGHPGSLSFARFVLGTRHWAVGDAAAAIAELEASANLGRAIDMPAWTAVYLAALSRAHLLAGDLGAVGSTLEQGAQIVGEQRGIFRGMLADVSARLTREQGDEHGAEALAHEALALLAEERMTPWVIDVLEFLGGIAAAQESHAEAARLFGAADTARRQIGYVRFPSQDEPYHKDLQRARSGLSDDGFADASAEGAAMILDDAIAYARRGRGERKRPSHGWASLTPTELEVARLVAERLTNPQIAERLFVSRSTVKAHLSHVYAKLGISSRMELADLVANRRP